MIVCDFFSDLCFIIIIFLVKVQYEVILNLNETTYICIVPGVSWLYMRVAYFESEIMEYSLNIIMIEINKTGH